MRRSCLIWGVALIAVAALLCIAGITEFVLPRPTIVIYVPGYLALAGVLQIARAFPSVTVSERGDQNRR
jgi:hypothetical protein